MGGVMTDHLQTHRDEESFSFGLEELRRATGANAAAAATTNARHPAAARLQVARPPIGGFDPYNSTGGFDRNNAWSRIRKR